MSDTTATAKQQRALAAQVGLRLGERLRHLRVAAGMTQTDLAGDRFSKEYVSQIERGKTKPTQETIAWIAARLGVDAGFLANGVSADERGRVDSALARADICRCHCPGRCHRDIAQRRPARSPEPRPAVCGPAGNGQDEHRAHRRQGGQLSQRP